MRRPPPHQQITQNKYAEQTAKEEQFKRMFCRSKMLKINKSTKQPTVLIKSSNSDSSLAKALSTSTTPASSSSSSALASAPVVTFSSSASSTSSSVINNHPTIPANFEILMETKDFKDNYKQQQVAVSAVDASYAALPQSQTQGRCVAALDSCNLSEDSFSFCFISALLGLH